MGEKDGEFGFGHIGIQMLMRLPREDVQPAESGVQDRDWNKNVTGKMSGHF